MNPVTVMYHDECYDGLLAAYAAWLAYGDHADYLPMKYGDPIPEGLHGVELFMVDFSVDPHDAAKLCHQFSRVEIIDHHISAIQKYRDADFPLPGNLITNFDTSKAGCILSAERFLGNVPWFFEYIGDRDIWKFEYPQTKAFTAGFFAEYPLGITTFADLHRDLTPVPRSRCSMREAMDEADLVATGTLLQKSFAEYVAAFMPFMKTAHGMNDELFGLFYNVPKHFISELGNYALDNDVQGLDYVAIANARSDSDKVVVSLRSRNDRADVSLIAKSFGGGGHRNAAGFEIGYADLNDESDSFRHTYLSLFCQLK